MVDAAGAEVCQEPSRRVGPWPTPISPARCESAAETARFELAVTFSPPSNASSRTIRAGSDPPHTLPRMGEGWVSRNSLWLLALRLFWVPQASPTSAGIPPQAAHGHPLLTHRVTNRPHGPPHGGQSGRVCIHQQRVHPSSIFITNGFGYGFLNWSWGEGEGNSFTCILVCRSPR